MKVPLALLCLVLAAPELDRKREGFVEGDVEEKSSMRLDFSRWLVDVGLRQSRADVIARKVRELSIHLQPKKTELALT